MTIRTPSLTLLPLVCLLLSACTSGAEQALPFSVVDDNYMFRTKGQYDEPRVVIYANRDEVAPPTPDLDFVSGEARDQIAQIDFQHYLVALIRHGRSPLSAKVKTITLGGDQVTILTTPDSIVGNYVVTGYTNPYLLIKIEKEGHWAKDIHFVWESETSPVEGDVNHFIP